MGHLRDGLDDESFIAEITPTMIDAGVDALDFFDSETGDKEEVAVKVYRTMEAARRSGP